MGEAARYSHSSSVDFFSIFARHAIAGSRDVCTCTTMGLKRPFSMQFVINYRREIIIFAALKCFSGTFIISNEDIERTLGSLDADVVSLGIALLTDAASDGSLN